MKGISLVNLVSGNGWIMIASSSHRVEFLRDPHALSAQEAICLNHAGISPIPERTSQKISHLAKYMTRRGSFQYKNLEIAQEEARGRCACLLGVTTEQVAFVRNTSEGLSYVALGLDWQAGDEIVMTDQEFPSNAVVWLDIARRFGVTVHRVPSLADGSVSAAALLARVNARTRVLAVSSVQFGTGAVVDLGQLGRVLRDSKTLLVVDAVQSLGVLPMDVETLHLDAVVAGGHKWLLAPEGCGLFYLSEKAMAQVAPRVLGWHSVANAGDYHRLCIEPRLGMRRFEAGTPNVLGAVALGESVNLLLEVGLETVQHRVQGLVGALAENLRERGYLLHTPLEANGLPGAGILCFTHPRIENARLQKALGRAGIEHAVRQRGVRFSPHFYQDQADVDRTMAVLDQAVHEV